MKELIEKYKKQIVRLKDERARFSHEILITSICDYAVHVYTSVIEDLEEYIENLCKIPSNPGNLQILKDQPDYPPLRERLICAMIPSFATSLVLEYDEMAREVIKMSDEIIKQLNKE